MGKHFYPLSWMHQRVPLVFFFKHGFGTKYPMKFDYHKMKKRSTLGKDMNPFIPHYVIILLSYKEGFNIK